MRNCKDVESTLERTAMSIGYPKPGEFIGDVRVDPLGEIISSSLSSDSVKIVCRSWPTSVRTKSQRSSRKMGSD